MSLFDEDKDNQLQTSDHYEMSPDVSQFYASLLKLQLEIQKLVSLANSCTYDQRIKYWKDKYVIERNNRIKQDYIIEQYGNTYGSLKEVPIQNEDASKIESSSFEKISKNEIQIFNSISNPQNNQNTLDTRYTQDIEIENQEEDMQSFDENEGPNSQDPIASGGFDPQENIHKDMSIGRDTYEIEEESIRKDYQVNKLMENKYLKKGSKYQKKDTLDEEFLEETDKTPLRKQKKSISSHNRNLLESNNYRNINNQSIDIVDMLLSDKSTELDDTQELLRSDYISPKDRRKTKKTTKIFEDDKQKKSKFIEGDDMAEYKSNNLKRKRDQENISQNKRRDIDNHTVLQSIKNTSNRLNKTEFMPRNFELDKPKHMNHSDVFVKRNDINHISIHHRDQDSSPILDESSFLD